MSEVNPDSAVLTQIREYWQNLFGILLWKTGGKATISIDDMKKFQAEISGKNKTLLTYGHGDAIDFSFVESGQAVRAQVHDVLQSGKIQ